MDNRFAPATPRRGVARDTRVLPRAITRRLIEEKRFTGVGVEADWPEAYRVRCHAVDAGDDPDADAALEGFARFPTWMDAVLHFDETRAVRPLEFPGMGFLDFFRRRAEDPPTEPPLATQVGRTPAEERAGEQEQDRFDPSGARLDADPTAGGEPERDRPPRSQ